MKYNKKLLLLLSIVATFTITSCDTLFNFKGEQGEQGQAGEDGQDGLTPFIGENGNWWIGTTDTGVKAEGGAGETGNNGLTPYIGNNGNWWIGTTDTGVKAEGKDGSNGSNGKDGDTPYIGNNGNWWIGTTDTGVKASGKDGTNGTNGSNGDNGLSAYEIYKKYHPDYEGTEEEWIDDYVNGRLSDTNISKKYNVVYYVDNEIYKQESVNKDSLLEKPNDPNKQCHLFKGWFDENDDKWIFNCFAVKKDINLYAKFEEHHDFNLKVINTNYCVKQNSCEEKGEYYYSCVCGLKGTETFFVDSCDHHFTNGVCDNCQSDIVLSCKNEMGSNNFNNIDNSSVLKAIYDSLFYEFFNIYMYNKGTINQIEIDILWPTTPESIKAVLSRVRLDNPIFYFIGYSFLYNTTTGSLTINVPEEYRTYESRKRIQDEIDNLINDCSISFNDSPFDILCKAHDFIIDRVDYEYINDLPSEEIHAHNIVGVIESLGAVCEGYSCALQLLCNYFNIPSYLVTGHAISGEAHSWNLVNLDSKWYWCDLTWDDYSFYGLAPWYDDPTDGFFYESRTRYFLVSDDNFCTNHFVDSSTISLDSAFMYNLPERANKNYLDDHESKLNDYIIVDDIEYQIVGFNSLSVSYINKEGDVRIPEEIEYNGWHYNVVSIGTYYKGSLEVDETSLFTFNYQSRVVVSKNVKNLYIPKSINLIYEDSLSSIGGNTGEANTYFQNYLTSISVSSNNTYFCSIDGVLYSKDKSIIIAYPFGNLSTNYEINESTILCAGEGVFSGKSNLKEIKINENFKDYRIFDSSRFLALNSGKITINQNNTYFYVYDNVVYHHDMFYYDLGMTNPLSATIIGFTDVTKDSYTILDNFTIGNDTYHVDNMYVFTYTSTLPDEAIFYGSHSSVFNYLTNAKSFNIENELFYEYGGSLIYTDTIAYIFADTTTLTVSKDIKKYYGYNYERLSNLDKIILEEGVETINTGAFMDSNTLKEIHIPSSVTSIGQYVFGRSYNITDVYYNGTIEQWNNITPSTWSDMTNANLTIHCLNGNVSAH